MKSLAWRDRVNGQNNWPYVFQLEYATIGPAFVDVCVPPKKKKKKN